MYWNVIEVRAIALRELAVRFADGLRGVIYIDLSFCTGGFESLCCDERAGCAKVDNGVLVCPNGLDLAPDTMYWEIKRNPQRRYDLKSKSSHWVY